MKIGFWVRNFPFCIKLFNFDLFPTEQVKYGWIAQNEFSFKKRKILITSNLSSYNVITIGKLGQI